MSTTSPISILSTPQHIQAATKHQYQKFLPPPTVMEWLGILLLIAAFPFYPKYCSWFTHALINFSEAIITGSFRDAIAAFYVPLLFLGLFAPSNPGRHSSRRRRPGPLSRDLELKDLYDECWVPDVDADVDSAVILEKLKALENDFPLGTGV